MPAINCFKVNDVTAEAFDGTQVRAEELEAAYPGIISIQSAETVALGDAILTVIGVNGESINAYNATVIVFTTDLDEFENETITATDVVSETFFNKYFVEKVVPN